MQRKEIKIGDLVKSDDVRRYGAGIAGIVVDIIPTVGWDHPDSGLNEVLNREQYTCVVLCRQDGKSYSIRAKHLNIISEGE